MNLRAFGHALPSCYQGRCLRKLSWLATIAVIAVASCVLGAAVAAVGPLEGDLGNGLEFLVGAMSFAVGSLIVLRLPGMQHRVFPKRNSQ